MIRTASDTALEWLIERGGDGVIDRHGLVQAGGDLSQFTREIWDNLANAKKIQYYKTGTQKRVKIIAPE